jgi:hypothetical protein
MGDVEEDHDTEYNVVNATALWHGRKSNENVEM